MHKIAFIIFLKSAIENISSFNVILIRNRFALIRNIGFTLIRDIEIILILIFVIISTIVF